MGFDVHYYQFNIGDYIANTARLSNLEDLCYRRLLDLYYLNERPFNECSNSVAREIGFVDQIEIVEFILTKYFTLIDGFWCQNRADKEILTYQNKLDSASKAGKASAKARKLKASERPLNDRTQSVEPNIKHKPLNNKHKTINTSLKDNGEFDLVWSMYEKKGNKKTSQSKFNKLTDTNKKLMSEHLQDYIDSTPDKQYRKNLETYINQECWNDEITIKSSNQQSFKSGKTSGNIQQFEAFING